MKVLVSIDGRPGELELHPNGQEWRLRYVANGATVEGSASVVETEPGRFSILIEGRSYETKVIAGPGGVFSVDLGGQSSAVEIRDPRSWARDRRAGIGHGRQTISAPMPGKVIGVLVREGDRVEAGTGLMVVEAMKMQNELKAAKAGVVVQISAKKGDTVAAGEPLIVIE
ncbi:MAG TPA: biotin/lipoyl-containing protein [Bryobacteraceae bacterium]|jgi:biotin carboxyl carrier protein|nr:biotin/lipoyl-containing protein [Bryobacteraceae bacterium]